MLNSRSDYECEADDVSSDATFNLFNWHSNNEEGLWLAGDETDLSTIRRLSRHPWLGTWDDSEDSFPEASKSVTSECYNMDRTLDF